jgi:hypothetical protein
MLEGKLTTCSILVLGSVVELTSKPPPPDQIKMLSNDRYNVVDARRKLANLPTGLLTRDVLGLPYAIYEFCLTQAGQKWIGTYPRPEPNLVGTKRS